MLIYGLAIAGGVPLVAWCTVSYIYFKAPVCRECRATRSARSPKTVRSDPYAVGYG